MAVRVALAGLVFSVLAGGCGGDDPIAGPASGSEVPAEESPLSSTSTTNIQASAAESANSSLDWIAELRETARHTADEAMSDGSVVAIWGAINENMGYHGVDWEKTDQLGDDVVKELVTIRVELEHALEVAVFNETDPAYTGPPLDLAGAPDLPDEFFLVQVGHAVVLVDPTGRALGHVLDREASDEKLHSELGVSAHDGRSFQAHRLWDDLRDGWVVVDGEAIFELGDSSVAVSYDGGFFTRHQWGGAELSTVYDRVNKTVTELPDGCVVSLAIGDEWYLICNFESPEVGDLAEVRVRRGDGTIEVIGGPAYGPYDIAGRSHVPGYWAWVEPGPDGAMLGQWSGECESPSGHVIVDGEAYSIAVQGGEVRLASRRDFIDQPDLYLSQSNALGWLSSGVAVIGVHSGPCGEGPDGIYLVTPQGELSEIYPDHGSAVLVRASLDER